MASSVYHSEIQFVFCIIDYTTMRTVFQYLNINSAIFYFMFYITSRSRALDNKKLGRYLELHIDCLGQHSNSSPEFYDGPK